MIRIVVNEILSPATWAEAACVGVFCLGLLLLAYGFGG